MEAVYQEFLDKITASKPVPKNDLNHGAKLCDALSVLYCRNGLVERAEVQSRLRPELCQHCDRKLPSNSFVLRQLAATRPN